jgi:uncharacterized glyoxalase superfamily protein PhnB
MPQTLIINIDVPNLKVGDSFYEAGLGFRRRRILFDGNVVEMESAAGTIFLIERPAGSVAALDTSHVRNYSSHWTPVHLDFAVTDLDAAITKALEAGATSTTPVSNNSFGKLAPMRDPFGSGFCFIEFSAAGYDAVASE